MQDWNDLEEFARCGSGEAFARIVQRYGRPVYAMCHRQLGDRQLSEDATQAVFLILWQRAARMRQDVVISGWLFQTARYVCANARRSERRRQDREREASIMRDSRNKQPRGEHELSVLLDDALASLRSRDRDTLLLRYAHDMSTADVAARLDLTEEAVRKRLSRAMERLRQYFAKSGVTADAGAIVAVLSPTAWSDMPQTLAQSLVATCTAGGASALTATTAATPAAASLAKGAVMAMNAHLVKLSTAGLAAGLAIVVTGRIVMGFFSSPPSDSTSHRPVIQVIAAGSNATAQLPPPIEQAERLSDASDWSAAIDAYGQYLRTLSVEQYRDKKDFDWILQKFEEKTKPAGPDGYRPLQLVAEQKLADRAADDPDVWRLHRLLAEIASKVGDFAAQREHLERAVAVYPPEVAGDPSKHSSLQHLYNSVAMLIARQDLDEAEKYLLDHFENDGRFVYVFLPPWSQLFASKGQPARYERFVDRVLAAYETKTETDPDLRELLIEYAAQTRQQRVPQRR